MNKDEESRKEVIRIERALCSFKREESQKKAKQNFS